MYFFETKISKPVLYLPKTEIPKNRYIFLSEKSLVHGW